MFHLISSGPSPTLWVPVQVRCKAHLCSEPAFGFVGAGIVETANAWVFKVKITIFHSILHSRITRLSSEQEHIRTVEALMQPADDVKIEYAHSKCMRNPNASVKWD